MLGNVIDGDVGLGRSLHEISPWSAGGRSQLDEANTDLFYSPEQAGSNTFKSYFLFCLVASVSAEKT